MAHRKRKRAQRSRESYLGKTPEARQRQQDNLLRGVTRAPEGHTRSLKHGAHARLATTLIAGSWSETIYAALAEEAPIRDRVDRDDPGTLQAPDRQLVELLASCLARLQSVAAWLELRGPLDEDGTPRAAASAERALRREAAAYLDALGMTPRSRAALGLDVALGMAAADGDVRVTFAFAPVALAGGASPDGTFQVPIESPAGSEDGAAAVPVGEVVDVDGELVDREEPEGPVDSGPVEVVAASPLPPEPEPVADAPTAEPVPVDPGQAAREAARRERDEAHARGYRRSMAPPPPARDRRF